MGVVLISEGPLSKVLLYRLHALKEPVYTQKEAEMAAGMGNYILKSPNSALSDVSMKGDALTADSSGPLVRT